MTMSHLDTLRLRLAAGLAGAAPSARLRALLPGLVAVAVAAELFACLGPGGVSRRLAADAAGIAGRMEQEDAALRRRLQQEAAPAEATREVDPVTFLRQLRTSAAHGTAGITRLAPRPHDPRTLDVELVASFPAFLALAGDIERLGARLHGVRIRPAEAAQDHDAAPRQSVAFSLEVPHRLASAGPADPGQPAPAPRDPFAAIPGPGGTGLAVPFVLTGLTWTGAGPMATIDNRDYLVGDRLGDMTITAIGGAGVSLEAGTRRLQLRFARPD